MEKNIKRRIFTLRVKGLLLKIVAPFTDFRFFVKRYLDLRKIKNGSQDNWEKHCKIRELIHSDELKAQNQELCALKIECISIYISLGMLAAFYELSQSSPDECNIQLSSNFQEEKAELVELLNKFNDFDGISFDETVKTEIIAWELEDSKSFEEIEAMQDSFSKYLKTLTLAQL